MNQVLRFVVTLIIPKWLLNVLSELKANDSKKDKMSLEMHSNLIIRKKVLE